MAAYNPNKLGWGFAAVVSVMTAGLFFTAKTIHDRTYRHPRDPMTQQVYHERDAAASHAAPAAEHGAMPGMDHGAPAAEHGAAPAAAPAGHDSTKPPEAKKH